ncbi:MAG: hypothetical protein IJF69_03770 [Clostridia bacterium]|nr:hypothetical protein [Clostridia bacterium]
MNKTEKRQFDLRNKLIAAIAMLLVSCIMMVSTTYAWFTLSTAPEIQGITTTVGANGNLEIALSPYSGNAEDITSNMGDANKGWAEKNLTWGNLLNLSDNSTYGLGGITLLPAALNVAGTGLDDIKVETNPLKTPTYGADGRPQSLNANTYAGSMYALDGTDYVKQNGFTVGNVFGVRAIGTSDSMTEWEVAFNAALSALSSAVDASKTAAQNSLNDNGSTLAGIMVDYGLGDTTATYTAEQVEKIGNILTGLENANAQLLNAIRAALRAEAAAKPAADASFDAERYEAAKLALADGTTIDVVAQYIADYYTAKSVTPNANITAAVATYRSVGTSLASARAEYTTVYNSGTYTFNSLSPVLNYIMNTAGVKINGKDVSGDKEALKNQIVDDVINARGVNIVLGDGSGVYADLAKAVGNLGSNVAVPEFEAGGMTISTLTANMVTNTANANGGYVNAAKLEFAATGAYTGDGNATASQVINVTYGYMVDFMFRTNASNSNLLLQTAPAQRVYEDSTSSATQGNGSTMTFAVDEDVLSVENTKNLMRSIRVVFMDTVTSQIFGIALLDVDNSRQEVDAEGNIIAVEADVYLHELEIVPDTDGDGKSELNVKKNVKLEDEDAKLCALNANTAKAVTTMVYLDGETVTNADVANAATSMTGELNLQFASDANLVPMENTALKEMEGEGEYKAIVNFAGTKLDEIVVTANNSYTYDITSALEAQGKTTDDINVSVTMGGQEVPGAYSNGVFNIPNVTGDIVVNVTLK